jgi:hypothetical protein
MVFNLLFPNFFPEYAVAGIDFTADITGRMFNDDVTGRIYVTDGRYRLELKAREEKFDRGKIVIADLPNKQTILLNPDKSTYYVFENFSFQAHMIDPFQAITYLEENVGKRFAGIEAVAGEQPG